MCTHGQRRRNTLKTCIDAFFHKKKRITQLEDTINEKDKLIRDKYTLNHWRTALLGFRRFTFEKPDNLDCGAVWFGNLLPTLRRGVPSSFSGT
jgi:hypothetical protein